MPEAPVLIDIKAVSERFEAAVAELRRAFIGIGRAARRSEWAFLRCGEVLPTRRELRIERRAERRRLARMLREQRRG